MDCDILLKRFPMVSGGVDAVVLSWFQSYLIERIKCVFIAGAEEGIVKRERSSNGKRKVPANNWIQEGFNF